MIDVAFTLFQSRTFTFYENKLAASEKYYQFKVQSVEGLYSLNICLVSGITWVINVGSFQ